MVVYLPSFISINWIRYCFNDLQMSNELAEGVNYKQRQVLLRSNENPLNLGNNWINFRTKVMQIAILASSVLLVRKSGSLVITDTFTPVKNVNTINCTGYVYSNLTKFSKLPQKTNLFVFMYIFNINFPFPYLIKWWMKIKIFRLHQRICKNTLSWLL